FTKALRGTQMDFLHTATVEGSDEHKADDVRRASAELHIKRSAEKMCVSSSVNLNTTTSFEQTSPVPMDHHNDDIDSNYDFCCDSFDRMNLKEGLLRGIFAYGFEKPSAIQQRAILPSIEGRNVIAQAQSGTGKTATFSIAMLQQINTADPRCQALVLAPTRELAKQIQT
ncbi:hypothetical protein X801_08024, partial [Opisthorchis viverrini]